MTPCYDFVMTPTLGFMPNQPKTPQRTVRVPDDVWKAAQSKAAERGENLSDVIRKALARYAARK